MTANAAGTNSLKCLPKHGGAQDDKFWSPIRCLNFANIAYLPRLHAERTDRGVIELLYFYLC
jgi:hypothetical protein